MQINDYLEHTRLNPDIADYEIDQLVQESLKYNFKGVCIPPFWVKRASRDLKGTKVNLVTVVGFPLGYQMTETKLRECEVAINNGVDEIDMVLNISAFKIGMPWAKIELAKCANLCHESEKTLKLIIETALLTKEEISVVSKMAADAGVDFVKTSTGFSTSGAQLEDVELIKKSIPGNVGIKASGGIKTLHQTIQFIEAGATRIGTSSAVNIFSEWKNQPQ